MPKEHVHVQGRQRSTVPFNKLGMLDEVGALQAAFACFSTSPLVLLTL